MRRVVPAAIAVALLVSPLVARQASKPGNPEDHLPPNITQLTWFGERASWSPDGTRIAFMEKSFGDAYEIEIEARATSGCSPTTRTRVPRSAVPPERRLLPHRRANVHRHRDDEAS